MARPLSTSSVHASAEGRWLTSALLLVALVFSGALDNGFVNWDDHLYLAHNPLVTDPGGQSSWNRWTTPALGYPLPLPVAIYGWLWRWGDGTAWPFHLTSLVIHLGNCLLFYSLLRRTGAPLRAALGGMLAFGCHPIVVEPVAWASGLKDLLATLGTFVALWLLLRQRSATPGAVLAWASKPSSVAVGPILFVFTWTCRPPRRWHAAEATLLTLVGAGVAVFAWAQEDPHLRTTLDVPWSLRRILAALGLQLEHLVAPARLAPAVTVDEATWLHEACAVVAIIVALAAWVHWLRRRDVRAGWLGLSLLAYAPASNLVPLFRFTADSYAYLPWAGVVAVLALSVPAVLASAARHGAVAKTSLQWLPRLVLPAWMILSIFRVEVWRDTLSLWGDAWENRSDNPEFIYRYGDALGRAGHRRDEIALYLSALDRVRGATRLPPALPLYFERTGEPERALQWYTLAFDRPLAQDEAMYWNYVAFVARNPELHPPHLDDALRYALEHLPRARWDAMAATERDHLQSIVQRLGIGSAPTDG